MNHSISYKARRRSGTERQNHQVEKSVLAWLSSPLFEPGFAADAIVRTGRTTQAGYRGEPAEAPRITEDVAMVLVNQDLAAQGSSATCSRADVRAALEYLNPLVRRIVRDEQDGSVVVVGGLSGCAEKAAQ